MTEEQRAFWEKYETETGEKVLASVLGRYISGWDEFPCPLWGLLIVTDAAFRFHHFAQTNWMTSIFQGRDGQDCHNHGEKRAMIQGEALTSAEWYAEKRWLKRFLTPSLPLLFVGYRKEDGREAVFTAETDGPARSLVDAMKQFITTPVKSCHEASRCLKPVVDFSTHSRYNNHNDCG